MAGNKITCSKRAVWEAVDAMGVLAGQRWPDTAIAIAIGRTFRRLREQHEDIDKDRTILLDQFAIKQEDDSYAREADGSIRLKDSIGFAGRWRDLLAEETTVEVFPVKLANLGKSGKKGKCKECQREFGVPLSAYQLETLVDIGALSVDEDADEKDEDE